MAGVRKGLDSAHIDLSITNEGVPFLWRPQVAQCQDEAAWSVVGGEVQASDMVMLAPDITWQQVRSAGHYMGKKGVRELISYKEWLGAVAELKTGWRNIWLEFRVPSTLLATMVWM